MFGEARAALVDEYGEGATDVGILDRLMGWAFAGPLGTKVMDSERVSLGIKHLSTAMGGGGGRGVGRRGMLERLGQLLEERGSEVGQADAEREEGFSEGYARRGDLRRAWEAYAMAAEGVKDASLSRRMHEAIVRLWRGGVKVGGGAEQVIGSIEKLIASCGAGEDARRASLHAEAAIIGWGMLSHAWSNSASPREVCRKASFHAAAALNISGRTPKGYADLALGYAAREGTPPVGYADVCKVAGDAFLSLGEQAEAKIYYEMALGEEGAKEGAGRKGGGKERVPFAGGAEVMRGLAVIALKGCKDGRVCFSLSPPRRSMIRWANAPPVGRSDFFTLLPCQRLLGRSSASLF